MISLVSVSPPELGKPVRPIEEAHGVDVHNLEAELLERIEGEVRFDRGARGMYATDGSNYRQVPIGVVVPRHKQDVIETVALCRKYGAPVLSRGGGTSLAGQCCNVAVVMDFSKYMRKILELDPKNKRVRVEPGCVLDFVRGAAEEHNLTYGPDPATHNHCTFGGMLGNNSCGVHSIMAGKTDANTLELEVLLYDGTILKVGKTSELELQQIIREGGRRGEIYARLKAFRDKYADLIRHTFPDIPRRVSGYNLPYLLPENGFDVAKALVGSEGTLVTILEATMRLVESPPHRTMVVLGYPDVYSAGDHVPEILQFKPIGLEAIDDELTKLMKKLSLHVEDLKYLPEGAGWLFVEFGGQTREEADAKAGAMIAAIRGKPGAPTFKMYDSRDQEDKLWLVRESGLGATAHIPGENEKSNWPGWEDSAVPPDKMGPYLRDFRKLLNKHKLDAALYGHFGQGCLHCRISFDLKTAEGIKNFRSFMEAAADLVVSYGGSLSGEHGDGQARAELLPRMYGDAMVQGFNEFKAIWDPDWKMNPGKIVMPNKLTDNLRLGTDWRPPQPKTHFHYPEDNDDFGKVAVRCVGIGECRRMSKKTMCPSYRVTHEEQHSTRGRAHLLFEMLDGNPVDGGWKSDAVHHSLDLCLACKGCKGDCPVNVDMATYKAEFYSHYYEGRIRPRYAYSMGLIYWWARLASKVPQLANFVTQTPGLSNLAKWIGGVTPERKLPPFATETFKDWFFKRPPQNVGKPQVILWPDTFNNYFHPEIGKATVEVLEHAGWHVVVPKQSLCCGRPLYDFGMLDTAKMLLQQILTVLRPEIAAGIPIVGMEPSCVTVFRDELTNLFPHDEHARRLHQQTYLLSEFLDQKASNWPIPKLRRRAIVHGHCHHKSIMKMTTEEAVLKRLGLDYEILDDGCCGMAGSFGFEEGKFEMSRAVGELQFLPSVRKASPDELIIADGFSCLTQMQDLTDRRGLHLAQVIQMAIREGPHGPPGDYPERRYPTLRNDPSGRALGTSLAVGAGLLLGGLLVRELTRTRTYQGDGALEHRPTRSRQPAGVEL